MPQLVSDPRYAMLEPTHGFPAEQPELTSLASGGFVATWRNADSIVGQMYDANGAPAGSPFEIAAGGYYASLAAVPSGGFVAVWEDAFQGVVVRIFDGEGNATTTSVISDAPDENGIAPYGRYQQPTVATLSSGDFVVAFTAGGGDDNGSGIRAQLFNASGEKIGGEFSVNSVTLGNQMYPRAVSLPDGGFLISWVDDWNGTYGAQIYDADGNAVGGQIEIAPGAAGIFESPS